MPFDPAVHANREIQRAVGLEEPRVAVPRLGDRTRVTATDYNLWNCFVHMAPLTQEQARTIWRLIPNVRRNNPTNLQEATALTILRNMCGWLPNPGCIAMIGEDTEIDDIINHFYLTPGASLFKNRTEAPKFIAFLNVNMDDGHNEKWYNMTGREQFEWFQAWISEEKTHQRREAATRGLRGTDPARITDEGNLRVVMARSPTLARRIPDAHPTINAAGWNNVVRDLFAP